MKKIGLLGAGKLARTIAKGLTDGKVPGCKLVGIFGRTMDRTQALADSCSCCACRTMDELLDLQPDFIIEAATGEALKSYALQCLSASCSMICLSVGVLSDDTFRRQIEETALQYNSKLYIANGVIGGLDLAATAAIAGPLQGTLTKYHYGFKQGMPFFVPDQFESSCREAFEEFPRYLNIAIAAGLACGDLDETQMKLERISPEELPGIKFSLDGKFGSATIECIRKEPGPVLAAWSALATLQRAISPISF